MEKYNWLLKKQTKALAVFREAGEQLAKVKAHIQGEISANKQEILELHDEIQDRQHEVIFLEQQHAEVHGQHEKIVAIVGPEAK